MELENINLIKKCEYMNERIPCFAVIKGDNLFFKSNHFLVKDEDDKIILVQQIRELFKQDDFNKGQLLNINNVAFSVDENDKSNNYFTGKNDFNDIIHIKSDSTLNYILIIITKFDSELNQKEIFELAYNLFEVKDS